MERAIPDRSDATTPGNLTRVQKLLQQEILACEDPICCCEPEPRWLRFEHDCDQPQSPCEWESIDRPPSGEL